MKRIDYSKLAKHVVQMTNRLQEGRMTKTQAVREVIEAAFSPLSAQDIQQRIQGRYAIRMLDSTITRRLREFDAFCERGKDGIFRYSLRKPQQPNLFKGA